MHSKKAGISIFVVLVLLCFAVNLRADSRAGDILSISGYYKNLPAMIDVPAFQNYFDDMNRLRLQFELHFTPSFSGMFDYDIEAHIGDFARSDPFRLSKHMRPPQFLDLEQTLVDNGSFYVTHSLYRAFFSFSFDSVNIRIGRQAAAWGPGLAWSPTDPFYPVNPLTIERDERIGADAVSVQFPLGPLSSINIVGAGMGRDGRPVTAARYQAHFGGTDFGIMASSESDISSFGIDFSKTAKRAEFHGALRIVDGSNEYTEAVLGGYYTFPRKLRMSIEYFHNGAGSSDKSLYDWLDLLSGNIQFLGKDYLFFGLDYELTPLLRLQTCVIHNLTDNGTYFNPVLKCSLSDNSEILAGWIGFRTSSGVEFSIYPDVKYLQFQYFF